MEYPGRSVYREDLRAKFVRKLSQFLENLEYFINKLIL